MRDIGANIRRTRTRRHLTQDDLAQTVHTTRQTISNYETGRSRPDVETLQRLADALGVELTELLDETPPADARRAALRRLCITGAVTLVLTGLWAYLHAVCLRQYQHGDMTPLAAMLITEPLLLCALAWTLLQALCMVTRLRPLVDAWYCCDLPTDRAATAAQLQQVIEADMAARPLLTAPKATVSTHADPMAALTAALAGADPTDRIVVFGSFYTVGGVLHEGLPKLNAPHLQAKAD